MQPAPLLVQEGGYAGAAAAAEPQGPSLAQVTAILRAYWKITVAVFVGCVLLAGIAAKLSPKSFRATATLIVNYDVNDPLAAKDVPIALLGNYMATQTDLVQAPEVLDAVIDRLKLTEDPRYADGNRSGPAGLHDWVATELRKNLDVEQSHPGSQLINITVYSRDPVAAADIANAIGDVYTEQHFRQVTGPASERAKRYTEELADLKHKTEVAQEALTQLRGRSGQIDLDGKNDTDNDNLTNLERRLLEAQDALRAAEARATADPASNPQATASEPVRALRTEGAALRSKMATLRTNYGPSHPQVLELQSQIDANTRALADAMHRYSSISSSDIEAARNNVTELENAVATQRHKILVNHQVRDQASKYELELESAQAVYKRALDGYDQIMFASSSRNSNVAFVSRARPPSQPEKRKSLVILLFGAICGLGLGLAGPYSYELLHRRIRCRDDVERNLGIPVLIELEAIAAERTPA